VRIIGVGLPKTGTNSLSAACRMLGFRSIHNPAKVRRLIRKNERRGLAPLSGRLRNVNAFFDGPYASRVSQLVQCYPDAMFILHTRRFDQWLVSTLAHNWRKGRADNKEALTEKYNTILPMVRNTLVTSGVRFIEMDITAGDGWEKLCPFLGVPTPSKPFPHLNSAASKTR
jgi:hypothetical protein